MFIVILDHDNMGVDAIFVTLLFITKKLWKKLGLILLNVLRPLFCAGRN